MIRRFFCRGKGRAWAWLAVKTGDNAVMRRIIPLSFVLLATLSLAPVARGQTTDVRTLFNADSNPILHIDLTAIDMNAVEAWRTRILMSSAMTAEEKDKQNQLDSKSMAAAKDWISRFRSAGGREMYVLVNSDGLGKGNFGLVLTPLTSNSSLAGLKALFNTQGTAVGLAGNLLVFGPDGVIARMQPGPPNPRPDLTEALKRASDAPFAIAVAPAALSDAAIFGGKQSLFRDPAWIGVVWGSLAVWSPPNVHGRLILQCRSSDAAQKIAAILTRQITDLANDPQTRQRLGTEDDRLARSIEPKVADSIVTITIDEQALDKLLMPVVMKQVQNSTSQSPAPKGVQIPLPNREVQVQAIMLACVNYRKDNQDQWPPNLDALVPKYLTPIQLKSDAHPDRIPGFIYRKPPSNLTSPEQFIFLYEAIRDGDSGDVYVGYAGPSPKFDMISITKLKSLLQN
jgi:hypothetical protein